MGLMLARLLVLEGRDVTLCDRHPQRRAQAEALGARAVERLGRHELVMEAVGRPESWRAAIEAARPGGTVVLVGGCPSGCDVTLPSGPLHYAELDVRGAFHHTPGRGRPRARAAGERRRRLARLRGRDDRPRRARRRARAPVGRRGAQARRRPAALAARARLSRRSGVLRGARCSASATSSRGARRRDRAQDVRRRSPG